MVKVGSRVKVHTAKSAVMWTGFGEEEREIHSPYDGGEGIVVGIKRNIDKNGKESDVYLLEMRGCNRLVGFPIEAIEEEK